MVYVEEPHMLSSFQRWALIYLHNIEDSRSVMQILKACCITAMDQNFEKKDVIEGLAKLEKMELIGKIPDFPNRAIDNTIIEKDLEVRYRSTADGIIYTKKMLKPVLNLVDKGGLEKIAQKLDTKTGSWIGKLINNAKDLTQQEIVQEIVKYGLGNIDGLSKLLAGLRS